MRNTARTAGRAAVAAAIGLALAVGTAAPAAAGTDALTRVKKGLYPTYAQCKAVGVQYLRDHRDAYDWDCPKESTKYRLYIIYQVG
jgi:hypothetical protein